MGSGLGEDRAGGLRDEGRLRRGRDTHGLSPGLFIHWRKRSDTRLWHAGSPLEQAVLMAFASLYLPGRALAQLLGPDSGPDAPADPRLQAGPAKAAARPVLWVPPWPCALDSQWWGGTGAGPGPSPSSHTQNLNDRVGKTTAEF